MGALTSRTRHIRKIPFWCGFAGRRVAQGKDGADQDGKTVAHESNIHGRAADGALREDVDHASNRHQDAGSDVDPTGRAME